MHTTRNLTADQLDVHADRVLARMGDLLAAGWTQRELAVTVEGYRVGPECNAATAFCMIGALRRALADLYRRPGSAFLADEVAREVRLRLNKAIDMTSLTVWNDAMDRTQAEVLKVVARARGKAG